MIQIGLDNASVRRTLKKLNKLPVEAKKSINRHVVKTAYKIDRDVKANINARQGKGNWVAVRNSNYVKIRNLGATIGNNHKAALYLEYGTRPHEIEVKKKKVLAKEVGKLSNEYIFFGRKVFHPGTKPSFFFRDAIIKNRTFYINGFKNILKK